MELSYTFLQHYWWLLISILGALLVFLLFVQGGQTLVGNVAKKTIEQSMVINSLGRKWEYTFTTLVVFGGAFFASFPLFYSTSFGGAYWLWMMILFSFIIQAVSYEFRSKKGNLLGTRVYDIFLFINGLFGVVLLGVAVGSFFSGSPFKVDKDNLFDLSMPVISVWQTPWHGLEALADLQNVMLGLAVFFLARVQGALYFMNNIDNQSIFDRCRRQVWVNSIPFVVFILCFLGMVLLSDGYETDASGIVSIRKYKYFYNLIEMPGVAAMLLIGVIAVLYAILKSVWATYYKKGIWFSGIGTVLVVLSLFFMAGYNHTPYYPSSTDIQSSLTIYNSSSSLFTLQVMSGVSLFIPVVLIYIFYAWRAMDKQSITEQEMEHEEEKY